MGEIGLLSSRTRQHIAIALGQVLPQLRAVPARSVGFPAWQSELLEHEVPITTYACQDAPAQGLASIGVVRPGLAVAPLSWHPTSGLSAFLPKPYPPIS